MTMKKNKIIIFNCYPEKSRKNFDTSDVGHPHDFFKDFFARYLPDTDLKVSFIADLDQSLPTDEELIQCRGCIWTGSDLTIYQLEPRVERQIELARKLYNLGINSFGSCWGIQMAAVAAGGKVAKSPIGREWGIAKDITLTKAGEKSKLLKGKPKVFDGFIMHLDEVVKLPENAQILAGNEHTKIQAIEVNVGKASFFGTQYHPEYNLFEMARLIKARAQALVTEGFFTTTDQVIEYAKKMGQLHDKPESEELKTQLNIDDSVIDPEIKEQELRNWLNYLNV
jgi:GMP synthase (glutamine-hydrolysing)